VKRAGYEVSEEDLKFDVLRSFANIYLDQQQVEEAVVDSARTFSSFSTIRVKFDEGKVLKPISTKQSSITTTRSRPAGKRYRKC